MICFPVKESIRIRFKYKFQNYFNLPVRFVWVGVAEQGLRDGDGFLFVGARHDHEGVGVDCRARVDNDWVGVTNVAF